MGDANGNGVPDVDVERALRELPDVDPQDPYDLESELATRLRRLSWPEPPPGLKERCLANILEQMEQANEAAAPDTGRQFPPRGAEQRHFATRSARPATRRQLGSFPPRAERLAAML